jgi:SlyX protein
MDPVTADERFTRIETKLAFIEDFLQRLQEEILERNRQSDRLEAEQKAVREKLVQLSAELEEIPNRKPPHY